MITEPRIQGVNKIYDFRVDLEATERNYENPNFSIGDFVICEQGLKRFYATIECFYKNSALVLIDKNKDLKVVVSLKNMRKV